VECGEYDYKGKKMQENQGQGFISGEQLKNIWCSNCLRAWKWRNTERGVGRGTKVRCTKCGRKDTVVDKKIYKEEKREILCPECRIERKVPWKNWGVAVRPEKRKAQQGSMWTEALKGTAREGGDERDVRRRLKPLRDIWLKIRIEKVNTYEEVIVKALLDSGTTGMFMDKRTVAKHGFRLQKLE